MIVLPPSWAIGALGIDARTDPMLARGAHYRLFTDPRLGLPLRPVQVWTTSLGSDGGSAVGPGNLKPQRRDMRWVDSNGRQVVAPFAVTPDNPVTGTMPTHGLSRCIWTGIEANDRSNIKVEIFRNSSRGPRSLGSRSQAPYSLGASHIDRVVISGSGIVMEAIWFDAYRWLPTLEAVYSEMGLPRDDRARYKSPLPGDSETQALRRVQRGAPRRFGLHDQPEAGLITGPPSTATTADERAKLEALAPMVDEALDELLDNTSAPQHSLELQDTFTDALAPSAPDGSVSTASYRPTDAIHTAMHDPTIARWLGFMDMDDVTFDSGEITVYLLRSWWAIDPAVLSPAEIASFLPSLPGLLTDANDDADLPYGPRFDESPDGLPIFSLWTPAVVIAETPPDYPTPPGLGSESAPSAPTTPDGLGPWLPSEPPQARRQAAFEVSGLSPAAGLALATDDGSVIKGKNERVSVSAGSLADRAMLLVPSVPADAALPNTGRLMLRDVPADGVGVRVAQSDLFGRWSNWSEMALAAKVRPAPPVPVFDLWYEQADPATATGMAWGRLTARVQVPQATSLAPGSHLLAKITVSGDIDGQPFSVEATPGPAETELVVEIPEPVGMLDIGQMVKASATARWADTKKVPSAPSAQRETTCVDGRQPGPVPASTDLEWTARPDATGRARVGLRWTVTGSQQRFRVYGCDEQRLRTVAVENGLTQFVDDLDGAVGPVDRAQVLRDHNGSFEHDWFQSLTDSPIPAPVDGSELSFQHSLSGSLGILAVYKVVAETEAGVAADFEATPLSVWAVPERSGPPRPLLEVIDAAPEGATLRIRFTGDPAAADRFRLRRSMVESDPRRMPVAFEGQVATNGENFIDITDDGTFVHDPDYRMEAGRLYTWAIEVQSPSLAGGKPGAWSKPSATVSRRLAKPPVVSATPRTEGR